MNQKSSLGLVVAIALSVTGLAQGQVAGNPGGGSSGSVYIEDFASAAAQTSSTAEGAAASPSSRKAEKVAEKVAKNAAALSEALVKELNAKGVSAYRLGPQEPVPAAGWVVSGVFSERVSRGLFSGFASLGSSSPNTEVTVNIRDLGAPAGKPVAVLNTEAQLTGQGSAIDFNPYVIAVKVVAHRVESNASIDDLAKRIAGQIVAQRSSLGSGV